MTTEAPRPIFTGTVTYRCAACGELIESGLYVMTPVDENGDITPETRTYHPEHKPTKEVTNGS